MATRKVWYGLSILMILGSFVLLAVRGLNYGIDFTGGVSVAASFPQTANTELVRQRLEEAGFVEPQVQNFGSSRDVAIRLPPIEGQTADQIRQQIDAVLKGIDAGAQIPQL